MTDIVIRVENLSKRYRIGLKEEMPETFTGATGPDLVEISRECKQEVT